MKRELTALTAMAWLAVVCTACGDSGASGTGGASMGSGGASVATGGSSGGGNPGTGGVGAGGNGGSMSVGSGGGGGAMPTGSGGGGGPARDGGGVGGGSTDSGMRADSAAPRDASGSTDAGSSGAPTADQVRIWVDAYKAAHPGNGGKDWDINAKTPAQIAADPAAQQLLSLCGSDQRPVIPLMAWEYGGTDHQWINPQASALVYCVYIPVNPSSSHWAYDAAADHVTADVYVRFPDHNPCLNEQGANQVLNCLGDPTNIEILVDTASLNDGVDVGLALANASSNLNLILADGTKVPLFSAQ